MYFLRDFVFFYLLTSEMDRQSLNPSLGYVTQFILCFSLIYYDNLTGLQTL